MTGKNITGHGILVCGCNGSGKSTLGKALAKRLGYHFIDNEDLFFPKTGGDYVYDSPRSKEEAKSLLAEEIRGHGRFVLAAVKGDYGSEILSACELAVVIRIPEDIRKLSLIMFNPEDTAIPRGVAYSGLFKSYSSDHALALK